MDLQKFKLNVLLDFYERFSVELKDLMRLMRHEIVHYSRGGRVGALQSAMKMGENEAERISRQPLIDKLK